MQPDSLQGQPAGFVTRLIAFIIDRSISVAVILIVVFVADSLLKFFNLNMPIGDAIEQQRPLLLIINVAFLIGLGIFNLFFIIGYEIFFWVLTGQTPGKWLLGLRVVPEDVSQDNITIWQGLKRYVGYWISAMALFMGYLVVLVNDDRRGWHDRMGGTRVVYDWEARQNEALFAATAQRAQLREQRRVAAGQLSLLEGVKQEEP